MVVNLIHLFHILGILQADPGVIRDGKQIFKLFCHEALRVFHDRLINLDDKNYFYAMLSEMSSKHFGEVHIHLKFFLLSSGLCIDFWQTWHSSTNMKKKF